MPREIDWQPQFRAGAEVGTVTKKLKIPISSGTPAGAAQGWVWIDTAGTVSLAFHDGSSPILVPITGVTTEGIQDIIGPWLNADLGDITGAYNDAGNLLAFVLNARTVTYAKMQAVSTTARVLGRITAGAGDVEELTGANLRTILGVLDADTVGGSTLVEIIQAAVDAIVAGAGSAWDTLQEIKAFIQTDESTAAALAITVAGKSRFQAGAVPNGATPQTINHALGLTNKNDFILSIKDAAGKEVEYDYTATDTNNISVIDETGTAIPTGLRYFLVAAS